MNPQRLPRSERKRGRTETQTLQSAQRRRPLQEKEPWMSASQAPFLLLSESMNLARAAPAAGVGAGAIGDSGAGAPSAEFERASGDGACGWWSGLGCGAGGSAGECWGPGCRWPAGNTGWPCAGLAVPDDERDESTVDADEERPVSAGRFGARMEPRACRSASRCIALACLLCTSWCSSGGGCCTCVGMIVLRGGSTRSGAMLEQEWKGFRGGFHGRGRGVCQRARRWMKGKEEMRCKPDQDALQITPQFPHGACDRHM
ncbi:hypothetical protein B0H17DRAFT_1093175 [Mycena rosella]|uniref:Uncharacterized protein n=1 Tax=Mycena rosella TaxID=1033263 RepID=A0AAD7CTM4_MYCRO|nr:hypothetical protein B0H17DRAFT_1093175 [Mycena rosella]